MIGIDDTTGGVAAGHLWLIAQVVLSGRKRAMLLLVLLLVHVLEADARWRL